MKTQQNSPRAHHILSLLFFVFIPLVAAESPHTFTGTLSLTGRALFNQDSDATLNPSLRGEWLHRGEGDFHGYHELYEGSVLLDYRVLFRQSGETPAIVVGETGQGVINSSAVAFGVEVYEAAFYHGTESGSLRAGRHFAPRRSQQRRSSHLMMLSFPVTDTIHPREIDRDNSAGLDGISLETIIPHSPIALRSSISFSEVYRRGGDAIFLRFTGEVSQNDTFGLTVGWQPEKYLRPGAYLQLDGVAGHVLVEGAVELYDPRQSLMAQDFLFGIRYETPRFGLGTSTTPEAGNSTVHGTVEYHYNELARTYPAVHGLLLQGENRVTFDGAGGFLRPGLHYLQGELVWSGFQWGLKNGITINLSDTSYRTKQELTLNPRGGPFELRAGMWWNYGEITTEFGRPSQSAALYTTLSLSF